MNNKHTRHMTVVGILAALLFIIAIFGSTRADTGHEGAQRIEIGRSLSVNKIVGSSVTGTGMMSVAVNRPDGMYFNNTGSTIWIGTVSATIQSAHTNVFMGFPVLASTTFKLGGSYTGNAYFTCNVGVANCEVRSLQTVSP